MRLHPRICPHGRCDRVAIRRSFRANFAKSLTMERSNKLTSQDRLPRRLVASLAVKLDRLLEATDAAKEQTVCIVNDVQCTLYRYHLGDDRSPYKFDVLHLRSKSACHKRWHAVLIGELCWLSGGPSDKLNGRHVRVLKGRPQHVCAWLEGLRTDLDAPHSGRTLVAKRRKDNHNR
jgi:hypothetical protein